ncbi:MAG: AI-2E family transporter [Candidatus Saccharimonadales bacterium]
MFNLRKNHILQAIVVLILLWLVVTLKLVLVVFFVAFLITVALHPVVKWLRERHIPAGLAVLLPPISLLILIALIAYFVAPNLLKESSTFATQIPDYIARFKRQHGLNFHLNINSLRQTLQGHYGSLGSAIFKVSKNVVELLVGLATIVVVTLYWLASYDRSRATLISYFPKKYRPRASDIWNRIEKKLVSWVKAQILLSLAVGVIVWIGALLIGLPFAGVLGLISGLLEIIPTLGPIAAAIPGVLLALTVSVKTALVTLILYVVVQQIENHLLAPVLLGRTVKLHPIIIIFSLLVGAELYGILGALLAVPVALTISAAVDSFREGEPKLSPAPKKN